MAQKRPAATPSQKRLPQGPSRRGKTTRRPRLLVARPLSTNKESGLWLPLAGALAVAATVGLMVHFAPTCTSVDAPTSIFLGGVLKVAGCG